MWQGILQFKIFLSENDIPGASLFGQKPEELKTKNLDSCVLLQCQQGLMQHLHSIGHYESGVCNQMKCS